MDVYGRLNLLVRRQAKENNFKAILACIRLDERGRRRARVVAHVFLNYGDPSAAALLNTHEALKTIDFKDTFWMRSTWWNRFRISRCRGRTRRRHACLPCRVAFPSPTAMPVDIRAESYVPPDPGPYPEDQPNVNTVRFTPVQVDAIRAGLNPGLTMVVGPPGTGKTDTSWRKSCTVSITTNPVSARS